MKRTLGTLVCCAIVALAVSSATRADEARERLRDMPPLLRSVSDEPGVLSLKQGLALSQQLSVIERETGVEIVVVILITTRPESTEAYVQRLINRWRRESKRLDHGRFVFVVAAKEDREIRIVPSEKFTWVLKSLNQSEVAVQAPALLKQDKYFEALTVIAEKLSRLIADQGSTVLQETETPRRFDTTIVAAERPRHP